MITKTQTRRKLQKLISILKKKGIKYDYPMSIFRHAIFSVVETFPEITDHKWFLNPKKQTTICILSFKTYKNRCEYLYKGDWVNLYLLQFNSIEKKDVITKIRSGSVKKIIDLIKDIQPKRKIIIKKNINKHTQEGVSAQLS
jgi:hypothetical protein